MTRRQAELLMVMTILARSTSSVFNKSLVGTMPTFNILGVRFLISFGILLPLLLRRRPLLHRSTILRGAALGFSFFLCLVCELMALKTLDVSTAAFLGNTSLVFVVLFQTILSRRLPQLPILCSVVLALAGVACMNGGGLRFSLSVGTLYCLAMAAFAAVSVLQTDRFVKKEDGLLLGLLQVGFIGVFGLVASFLVEIPRLPESGAEWGSILVLAVICTGLGYTLKPATQRYITPERTGLLGCLYPVFSAFWGIVLLSERLSVTELLGVGLIFASLLLPNLTQMMKKCRQEATG